MYPHQNRAPEPLLQSSPPKFHATSIVFSQPVAKEVGDRAATPKKVELSDNKFAGAPAGATMAGGAAGAAFAAASSSSNQ